MADRHATFDLPGENTTRHLARRLAQSLQPGDTLLLSGQIGAGKTFLTRALIQSLLTVWEDVPSPTYTLVQTYDTSKGELWHCDLYRVTSTDELEELGLTDAFDHAICIVEWPDRLGDFAPTSALRIALSDDPAQADYRRAVFAWSDPRWDDVVPGFDLDPAA